MLGILSSSDCQLNANNYLSQRQRDPHLFHNQSLPFVSRNRTMCDLLAEDLTEDLRSLQRLSRVIKPNVSSRTSEYEISCGPTSRCSVLWLFSSNKARAACSAISSAATNPNLPSPVAVENESLSLMTAAGQLSEYRVILSNSINTQKSRTHGRTWTA